MPENKCPKCGATGYDYCPSPRLALIRKYYCGSYIHRNGNLDQSPRCRIRELEEQLAEAQADYDAEAVRLSTAVNAELDRAHKELAKAKSEIECMRESFCAMREAQASVVRDALTPRSTADPADAELRRAIAEAEVKKLKAELAQVSGRHDASVNALLNMKQAENDKFCQRIEELEGKIVQLRCQRNHEMKMKEKAEAAAKREVVAVKAERDALRDLAQQWEDAAKPNFNTGCVEIPFERAEELGEALTALKEKL